MNVRIFIASYSKDVPYLEWCLKSIAKFATGFSGTTVVVPKTEMDDFLKIPFAVEVDFVSYERIEDQAKWQLQAQAQKCLADQYCQSNDVIFHMDSDCIFTEPVTPEDYIQNGKPVMLIEAFDRLSGNPWKAVTEAVLGEPVKYETMRRHPQLNPTGIYSDLRSHIERKHRIKFQDFVLSRKADYPWGFSEHCALGAYALAHPKWKTRYHWIDIGKETPPKEKLRQFWSLSPIDQPQGTPHDHDTVIPLEICQRIIGV